MTRVKEFDLFLSQSCKVKTKFKVRVVAALVTGGVTCNQIQVTKLEMMTMLETFAAFYQVFLTNSMGYCVFNCTNRSFECNYALLFDMLSLNNIPRLLMGLDNEDC